MLKFRAKKLTICLGALAILTGILGAVIFGCSWLVRYEVTQTVDKGVIDAIVVDSHHSSGYKAWSNNFDDHAKLYQDFYFFNLTNLEEVKKGAFPIVKQIGPYAYWAKKLLIDVEFSDHGNIVTYNSWERWDWLPEKSCDGCTQEDVIYNFNPAYLGALSVSGGELQLLVAFTGPAIRKVFDFLWTTFTFDMLSYWRPNVIGDIKSSIIVNQTETEFYSTWANATTQPTDPLWKGMVVSLNKQSSGISVAAAKALWNEALPYALRNTSWTSATTWRKAGENNTSAISLIASTFNITNDQVHALTNWLITQANPLLVTPNITKSFSISNLTDLAYLQWGQGLVAPGGMSVSQLYPEIFPSSPPELSLWYKSIDDPFSTLDLTACKTLLSGPYGVFEATNIGELIAAYEALDWATIKQKWDLDEGEAVMFAVYALTDVTYNYATVDLEEIFLKGGGLFTNRTVHQWLWNVTDPLLQALEPSAAQAAIVFNETSEEVARSRHAPSVARTGKDHIKHIGDYISWQGQTSLPAGVYSKEIPVAGTNDLGQFPPWMHSSTVLTTWDSNYVRPIDLVVKGHQTVHGVKMFVFEVANSTWEPSYLYNQPIQGFCNLTGLHNGSTVFISNPHMYLCDPDYVNKVTPMAELQNITFDTVVVGIEPHLGTVLKYDEGLQINVYLDPKNNWFNWYNKGVTLDVFYPLVIVKESSVLREKDAKLIINNLYKGIKLETTLFYVALGIGIGMMAILFPLLTGLFVWKYRKDRRTIDEWGYDYQPVSLN